MRRSHACRRAGRGAEQSAGYTVNHIDYDRNLGTDDRNHASDDRGLNRDSWTVDDHNNATAC